MADLSQPITAPVRGAYATMVVLSDNSISSLADFQRAPGGRTINRYLQGAYSSLAKKDSGVVRTSVEMQAGTAGDLTAEAAGGYNDRVQVDGEVVSLVAKIIEDGKAP